MFPFKRAGGEGSGEIIRKTAIIRGKRDLSIGEALFTCSSNKDAVNCDMYLSEAGLFCFLNSFFDHVGVQSVVKDRCKELTEQ